MRSSILLLILTISLALIGVVTESGKVSAGGLMGASTLWLSCENGARYPIHPIAVSDEGDLVEGEGTAELLDDGTIEIEFAYHNGDEAVLKAKRDPSSTAC